MNPSVEEIEHILDLVIKVEKALKEKDTIQIKKISEEIIQHSAIHQDEDIVALAVIMYALSKLIEREDDTKGKNWGVFYRKFYRNIHDMIQALRRRDLQSFREEVSANRKLIHSLSGDVKHAITDVFIKAKIKKS